jgi:hypothetical protein
MEDMRIRTDCPECGNNVLFGYRRVGPSHVECRHCGKVLSTGYEDWDMLDKVEKRNIILKELFFPSWTGITGLMGFIYTFFVIGPFALMPGLILVIPVMLILLVLILIVTLLLGDSIGKLITNLVCIPVCIVVGMLWPNILFLYKSIRDSRKLKRTGQPPIW